MAEEAKGQPTGGEIIVPVKIEEEMEKSYIDYAMSVIVGRALPDVRDGLKPVHRRILYAMHELGMAHSKPYKKSARIVGEVLGKYHPHGDAPVYEALVRMTQDFSMRYPLIDGQGNFGSVDGDEPAAMRYTEVRLAKIAEEMLADTEKETVDFAPNFDDSLKEPKVLPAKLPNLLLNGSSGIAVGMTTNIPPHNLSELVDAITSMIDDPEISAEEIMEKMPGPDFQTGAIIYGKEGIVDAYKTGRGSIKFRAKCGTEELKSGKSAIIVTEIPYQVNKASLVESIAELVNQRKIDGISDLRDESDREGMRVVIELKGTAVPEVVLNQLYKHTQLESTFGIINLAIVDGEPKVLGIKEFIQEYIDYRKEVVTRRTRYELAKAEARVHILEGLKIALANINEIIKLIRASKDAESARDALMSKFPLSREQALAILDMRLQRLTALERSKVDEEHADLKKRIKWLREVLASVERVLAIIKEELAELKKEYGDERRTEIKRSTPELTVEDLIAEEDMVVTITEGGYIKRLPLATYRQQHRAGKGIIGMETKEEDIVSNIFIASTHNYMLFFSSKGKVHWKKVYEVPMAGRYSKGKALANVLTIEGDEKITACIPVEEFDDKRFLFVATKQGLVKKTPLSAYNNPRRGGIIGVRLRKGDELVSVAMTDGKRDIILASKYGKAIRFSEKDARPVGRGSIGVRGMKLRRKDEVIGMEVVREELALVSITENGFGKRTKLKEYPRQRRGGQGVINIIPSPRNGPVIGISEVSDGDELVLTSASGVVIRLPAKDISMVGRNTQGVRVMRVDKGDKVVALAKVAPEE